MIGIGIDDQNNDIIFETKDILEEHVDNNDDGDNNNEVVHISFLFVLPFHLILVPRTKRSLPLGAGWGRGGVGVSFPLSRLKSNLKLACFLSFDITFVLSDVKCSLIRQDFYIRKVMKRTLKHLLLKKHYS